MSVLKAYRSLSEMEFWMNAKRLRSELTVWVMRDFGNRYKSKDILPITRISEDDRNIIKSIIDKYDINDNQCLRRLYPEWFSDDIKKHLIDLSRNIMINITSANTIYPVNMHEADIRRDYQNRAIIFCYDLYQELDYATDIFKSDYNKLIPLLELTEREIVLLKGWRKSDYSRALKRFNNKKDLVNS